MNKRIMELVSELVGSFEKQSHLPNLRKRLSEEFPNDMYRQMIVFQRCRQNTTDEEPWEGRDEYAPAETRYPNILAEFDASGYWMDRIIDFAGVSPAAMAAVMEDMGELSAQAMLGLARCFGCRMNYLAAPILSTVDPSTNKGKARRRYLNDLLRTAEGIDNVFIDTVSKSVLSLMEKGQPITYAKYRVACRYVRDALYDRARDEARRDGAKPSPKQHGNDLQTKIKQARERDVRRKNELRLAKIRECVDNAGSSIIVSSKDLVSLASFAGQDLYGALALAICYGKAIGVHPKPSH